MYLRIILLFLFFLIFCKTNIIPRKVQNTFPMRVLIINENYTDDYIVVIPMIVDEIHY
ncbi:hypothetical protein ACFLTH_00940 [Bacteroidota bacterium]